MTTFPDFTIVGGRGYFRPVQSTTLEAVRDMFAAALVHAREQGLSQLLIDARELTGFDPPTTFERYFLVNHWIEAAAGQLQVALVARPEVLDPQKFGVRVAQNRGFLADSFVTEEDAIAWLDGV